MAKNFFQLLKQEQIKRNIYTARKDARSDVFDYIEMFYNVKRRHGFNNQLSPVEFKKRYAIDCAQNGGNEHEFEQSCASVYKM